MPDVVTISTQKPQNSALDYEELRKTGIQHLEKTASSIWTDYNVHDPGITTLEFLCYALTDLSYRSTFSIPDLLATEENTVKNIQQHFFSAKQIFPNKALTINDYRKLLIDIVGVKNAWLKKRTKQVFADISNKKLCFIQPTSRKWEPVDIKGYYDILLEFDTDIPGEAKTGIKNTVQELLMANRNVCEDFLNVKEVTKQEFRLCCELEVTHDADPFGTLAQIFFNVQLYLTPLVKFYKLQELFDDNCTSDEIFEGPLLTHGFIKENELNDSDLKTEIHLSDIMSEILKVDSVINILDIIFNPTDQAEKLPNKWIIEVAEGEQPVMNITESNMLLYKNGIPFRPDKNIVKARFEKLMSDYITGNDLVRTEDITYETGTYQNTESYYSIQNHYPKNYGISHWGLPADASDQRKIQAKQLQGYLYFFDQQMANYLSQLSHLRNLFSMEDEKQTYFTELADSFKDADDLFVNPALISNNIQSAAEATNSDLFYKRRNLFLDHLLSRFSETFSDYVNILNAVFPVELKDIIGTKINFLKNYPDYSSQRCCAYNYTDKNNLWDSLNISGLEKRLEHLLGFQNVQRHTLVNVYSAISSSTDASSTQFWFKIIDNRSSKILLKAAEKSDSEETAGTILDTAWELAKNAVNFTVVQNETDHTFTYQLKDATNKIIGISNDSYPSAEPAQADLTQLVSLLSGSESEEGMYLVEHLLLLPQPQGIEPPLSPVEAPSSPVEAPASPVEAPQSPPQAPPTCATEDIGFMPICVDDNCDDCETKDPYSFRISIILPAYATRFLNMDFRGYCERIIRMETPSHIFPKICWVSNEDLQKFETAYKTWLDMKAGNSVYDKNILKQLIAVLTTIKTVYPPARLEDCASTEERKLFLLNQNALGTLKT